MDIRRLSQNGGYRIAFTKVEQSLIRRLAVAYSIPFKAMVIACMNKGMDVIGKQVKDTDRHDGSTDDHSQDD